MSAAAANRAPFVHRVVEGAFDPADVVVKFAAQAHPAVLESACNTAGYGRFSLFACAPVEHCAADAADDTAVRAALARIGTPLIESSAAATARLPFVAGWIGCIPYEAGAVLESVRRERSNDDAARLEFSLYDAVVVYDHAEDRWHVCAVDLPQSTSPAIERAKTLTRMLLHSPGAARDASSPWIADEQLPVPDISRDQYLRAVNRAIAYIAAGDIYQVNVTQRFSVRTRLTPLQLYLRLRAANPADYAALLPWGHRAVVSASPELFLSVSATRDVLTRPIKGTRPRDESANGDAVARAALLASPKDRAELNMIIDLLRNDLGRVCEFGSVQVRADADIEIHPTVLHLVGTIIGRLRQDVTVADLLRATLPGGSITGCPKIRAMQIINELEPTPRGAYCGAIGYIGLDGAVGLNVAIRTMQYDGDLLHLYAGGAITADSDPEAEYCETLAKAEGMFRALGHTTAALDVSPAVG